MPKETIMTRYEIADGRTFETLEEAEEEEQKLNTNQLIRMLVENNDIFLGYENPWRHDPPKYIIHNLKTLLADIEMQINLWNFRISGLPLSQKSGEPKDRMG